MNIKEIIKSVKKLPTADLNNYVHGKLKARTFNPEEPNADNLVVCVYDNSEDAAFNFMILDYEPESRTLTGQFVSGAIDDTQQLLTLDELSFMELLELAIHL